MHIPDGFLTIEVHLPLTAAGAVAVAWASRRAGSPDTAGEATPAPKALVGVAAAFVFAAQMVMFPVLPGVAGHFAGGAFLGILLGPSLALLAMAAVLIIQCLVYQDGGLTALGANFVNFGLLGTLPGWAIFGLMRRRWPSARGRDLAAFLAGWAGVVLGALACGAELVLSGRLGWGQALYLLGGVHALIGVGEGLITAAALRLVASSEPGWLPGAEPLR